MVRNHSRGKTVTRLDYEACGEMAQKKQLALSTPPNVIARDFKASAPNEKWVGDITYLRTREGFLCLATLRNTCRRLLIRFRPAGH